MGNFNKVMLMGNLTRDPEYKALDSRDGKPNGVCKVGLAVNRQWRNGAGEKQEEVCFVDCVAFGRTAEIANEYLRKGRAVFIEGRLKLDTWEDRETRQKRSKLEVVIENLQLIGSRDGGGDSGGGGQQSRDDRGSSSGSSSGGSSQSGGGKPNDEINFDDIPF